ncbi:MAG: ChbG/HpnK family deacetylase [Chromatiales bacterium]|nr:ChbG/HpnK family deacetylase [Gammaproteobacteria bacterium]
MNAPRLIINADDYALTPAVSRGIREAISNGSVTATGIIANSPHFYRECEYLHELPGVDIGVHLNLTFWKPLISELSQVFWRSDGYFPGKSWVFSFLLKRDRTLDLILEEFRAQVRQVQKAGFRILFINSHEHLHMLPWIFPKVLTLADEFNIPFVRWSTPDKLSFWPVRTMLRDLGLNLSGHLSNKLCLPNSLKLIGFKNSGKLTYDSVADSLSCITQNGTYELMCHPGLLDDDKHQLSLLSYHNWVGELMLINSKEFSNLLLSRGIQLTRFRDLS